MQYCSNKNNMYGNSTLPRLLTTSFLLRINLSPSQRNTLRLQEFKVICSGPHGKTFLVKFQAKSDAKLWSHNSCFFRWVWHDP